MGFCKPLLKNYQLHKSVALLGCRVSSDALSFVDDLIKLPAYLQYAVDWVVNFKHYFLQELYEGWTTIVTSIAISIVASYVYLLVVVYFAGFIIYSSYSLVAIFCFALAIAFAYLVYKQFGNSEQYLIYGYESYLNYILGGILILFIFVFFIVGIVVSVGISAFKDELDKSKFSIKLCGGLIKYRFRMFAFYPLLFVLLYIF